MEKERDFYFGKLRNIELICQEKEGEDDGTLANIMGILYATDVSAVVTLLLHCYYTVITPVQRASVGARRPSEDGGLEHLWGRVLLSSALKPWIHPLLKIVPPHLTGPDPGPVWE